MDPNRDEDENFDQGERSNRAEGEERSRQSIEFVDDETNTLATSTLV